MIGFTGTRHGMTYHQRQTTAALLKLAMVTHERSRALGPAAPRQRLTFHHGMCVGSDEQAHELAVDYGYLAVGHPASDLPPEVRGSFKDVWSVQVALPALDRDAIIADQPILIATPHTFNEVRRSGTWSTIRYGWRHAGTLVWIVKPDGHVLWTVSEMFE